MPITRYWSAKMEHGVQAVRVQFECPFFNELLMSNGGCLSRDFEAHALWDYYGCALQSAEKAKRNLVEESEVSICFDQATARNLFIAKANQHGVRPDAMVRFWPMMHRQRIALGGKDQLPEEFQFHYWGN